MRYRQVRRQAAQNIRAADAEGQLAHQRLPQGQPGFIVFKV
jgi:hypothetical protein